MGDVAAQDIGLQTDPVNADRKGVPRRQDRVPSLDYSAFYFSVLCVGLALVFLGFDRANAITRTAAPTFLDRVAEHTAERGGRAIPGGRHGELRKDRK